MHPAGGKVTRRSVILVVRHEIGRKGGAEAVGSAVPPVDVLAGPLGAEVVVLAELREAGVPQLRPESEGSLRSGGRARRASRLRSLSGSGRRCCGWYVPKPASPRGSACHR